ncbi:hypothetical protein [Microvirga yunnanensis]|uniref:hypothetical protein n=1 Tax=Microvirga yunnanensis TaxID=2953740 RepID=UPI0021C8DFD2|nr:hypothetical protein [Microvirga sp. HBU65207]
METGATLLLQGGLWIPIEESSVRNGIYARSFPKDSRARIFVNVPAWPEHFDIEIDGAAAL